jgi:uncharacterized membrane protein (DUF2068 family)
LAATVERPLGLTLLALWSVVVGAGVLGGAAYYYANRQIPAALFATFRTFSEGLVIAAAVVFAFNLLTAYGLWKLRTWGRLLAYAFAVLGVAVGMLTLPFGIIGVVVSLTTAWYLTEPRIRGLFRAAQAR